MKLKRLKIIILLIMLLSTYQIYAAETGSVDSSTPQETEVLNKNRTILMGVDFGGSTNIMSPNTQCNRSLMQFQLTYRFYYYPNNFTNKVKNGICLDFGLLSSFQGDINNPMLDKEKALYLSSSILYSLISYKISAYHNLLFNIGFNGNFFLKKMITISAKISGYSYNFAQVGILMEIGYVVYTPDFKRAFVFKLIFKGLTEDISPVYSNKFSFYSGFTMSLLFNSN